MTRQLGKLVGASVSAAMLMLASGWGVGSATAADCTLADLQSIAPADTTVTAVSLVPAAGSLPEYCRVDAFVTTPGNMVNFRLGLPTGWNGKFYFVGVGGFAGSIGSLDSGLSRRYATASTDTGHQGSSTDASWALNNLPKIIDYGHCGTHVTAVAAKSITRDYYGTPALHSYFVGCSNGGRQALMEAQRYPADFDGIIAGDPSFATLGQINRTWGYQALLSDLDHYIPAAKIELISNAVLAECDARDGLVDGLIGDPRRCRFDPRSLQCPGEDGPNCLTAGQVETLAKIYAGATNSAGEPITLGFPMGHEAGATGWPLWIVGSTAPTVREDGTLEYPANPPLGYQFQSQFLKYLAFEVQDPAYDWRTFDFDTDPDRLGFMTEIQSPSDPDLSTFRGLGGKLIMYHGWSDPALSALATIRYYEHVVGIIGQHRVDRFLRLFMVPGMHHCSGGPGPNVFDIVTPLENWVERREAPARIIAAHLTGGVVDRTRPLCPYPEEARYRGHGSIDDAANFACRRQRPH